jgi:hypothetical protein
MDKEKKRKRPIFSRKSTYLFLALGLIAAFSPQSENTQYVLKALNGDKVECPPGQIDPATDAMVIADAGMDDGTQKSFPNSITERTFNAAAITYVEARYKGHTPNFVVMLNNNKGPDVNKVYRNRLRGLVDYYSHHKFTIPNEAFLFSNTETTAQGIDDLEELMQVNNIRSANWIAWPNQNRGAIDMCLRGIPTTTTDVNALLERSSSLLFDSNERRKQPFKYWHAETLEKTKILPFLWMSK